MQVLVFFNELSGNADAAADANALLGDLVAVLREVRRRRPGASLIAPKLMEHKVKTDVTMRDLYASRSRTEVQWLMRQRDRAPFLRTDESGVEYRHDNLVARGLGDAHFYDGIALSLQSHPQWKQTEVVLDRNWLDVELNFLTDEVRVRHAANCAHLADHLDWLTTGVLDSVRAGADLWQIRAEAFPRLRFLPRTESMISGLERSHVRAVTRELALLDRAATEWDPGREAEPKWPIKVTHEHETRRNSGEFDFVDEDNQKYTFDWHSRFTGNVPGRVYFRLAHSEHRLVIAHVGRKISA